MAFDLLSRIRSLDILRIMVVRFLEQDMVI